MLTREALAHQHSFTAHKTVQHTSLTVTGCTGAVFICVPLWQSLSVARTASSLSFVPNGRRQRQVKTALTFLLVYTPRWQDQRRRGRKDGGREGGEERKGGDLSKVYPSARWEMELRPNEGPWGILGRRLSKIGRMVRRRWAAGGENVSVCFMCLLLLSFFTTFLLEGFRMNGKVDPCSSFYRT